MHDIDKKLSYIRNVFWFTKSYAEETADPSGRAV